MAGLTVALVLVPQSLAYAALAGMPPERGLYVAAVATLVAAPFASSPYLQTGPVALTALLSFGAVTDIASPGTAHFIGVMTLLALVVGVVRVLIGVLRLGGVAYLMSQPVLTGFTAGAAIVIVATQIPAALGAVPPSGNLLGGALSTLAQPARWDTTAAALAMATLVLTAIGRRLHPLFPGVLVAVVGATAVAAVTGYDGPTVGDVPAGLPSFSVDLPWRVLPNLLLPGVVVALVGFAEASAIARAYAALDRQVWDPSREFVSQGLANLAAATVGGFPAGGSFSRSAINRLAGARTPWSGAVTGVAVLLFLPFLSMLSSLPLAVLAAVVIGAVGKLAQPRPFLALWRYSRLQFLVCLATLAFTLAFAPQVQQGVILGVLLAVAVHLRREILISVPTWTEGDAVHLKPRGVLYFGSVPGLERTFMTLLHDHPDARRMVIHLDGLGRVDVTGALALQALLTEAEEAGLEAEVTDVPPQARKIVARVLNGSGAGRPPSTRRGRAPRRRAGPAATEAEEGPRPPPRGTPPGPPSGRR